MFKNCGWYYNKDLYETQDACPKIINTCFGARWIISTQPTRHE